MKDRIIEMLGRGERVELKLADKMGFIEQGASHLVADGLQRGINTVCYINSDNNVVVIASGLDDMLFVQSDDHLKYFKIKEPEYAFNDLIDAAVQAYKDGYIRLMRLDNDVLDISYNIDGDGLCGFLTSKTEESGYQFDQYIRDINSLYTETFVIESEEDVLNVKDEAEILFLNGVKAIFADSTRNGHYGFVLISNVIHKLPLALLKGATVTQKRGNQCNK